MGRFTTQLRSTRLRYFCHKEPVMDRITRFTRILKPGRNSICAVQNGTWRGEITTKGYCVSNSNVYGLLQGLYRLLSGQQRITLTNTVYGSIIKKSKRPGWRDFFCPGQLNIEALGEVRMRLLHMSYFSPCD
jgi:hypothetical protein